MKLKAAIAAVLTACLLSGCNITGLDAQTLMRPPKATGDREAIHTALEESVQGNLILKYPTRGEYRSAITMYDLTGDGVEEAIAFCEAPEENSCLLYTSMWDCRLTPLLVCPAGLLDRQ